MTRLSGGTRHLLVGLFFIVLAVAGTWPLGVHLSTHIPGEPGDNLAFLWNIWWMREALASGDLSFLHTNRLFAPFGIDLTLHTHTALSAWFAGVVLARLDTVPAQNVVILAALALNGYAMYLLAWDRTRDRGAAVAAGVIFGGAPYLSTHLLGHFNLVCAWGPPLFVLWVLRAIERRSLAASIGAGACLIAIAYTDYYYLLYALVLGTGFALSGAWRLSVSMVPSRLAPPVRRVVIALIAIDALQVVAIQATGGFDTTIAGIRVVATRPTNLLTVGWILAALLLLSRLDLRAARPPILWDRLGERCRALLPAAVVTMIGISPLVAHGWALLSSGDYAAPAPSWRSGPAGVDLATLWLGNPSHPAWGAWTRSVYEYLGVNRVEGVAWIGVAPMALVGWAAVRDRRCVEVRRWLAVGAVFFVWALGPWLRVGGFNTGMLLPQNVLAYVPIVSNARMPGRAMVIVGLAVAMTAAIRLSRVPVRWRRYAVVAVLVLTVVDYAPAPFPLTRVDIPELYARLRDMPSGAVCELPMGIRDGLGVIGVFDDRTLTYQMVHGHPLVGGFAARIPTSIKKGYEEIPILRSLWRLSQGQDADSRDGAMGVEDAGAALLGQGVAFIVLNRAEATHPLVEYLERSLPLTLVAKEGARELYRIRG